MKEEYLPQDIELSVQKTWADENTYSVSEDSEKEKFYCLAMFPYPSGKLHMGHVRNYTIGDVISRYQRFLGKNVMQPMGWDAFGLPAENAAIQNSVAPATWTDQNISSMRDQLSRLGFGYDWGREVATCKPDYYKWEQWFFTRLYEKGVVYKAESEVNWDPVDQTVLANEQVVDGRGWRSGALVEKRKIPQWFLRITDYAEELLTDLDKLEGWPESVKIMQRNWIGRSEGVEAEFALSVEGIKKAVAAINSLTIYTTRPDTMMGVTYLAVAAEHPLAQAVAKNSKEVTDFIVECRQSSTAEADMETMDKKGIDLGIQCLHPITGEPIPVWCANFVLMSYGTGAVMAVPAHDQRDYEFATRYGIEIKPVIYPADGSKLDISEQAYTEYGIMKNSGEFNDLDFKAGKAAVIDWLANRGLGERKINYRLRDWGVSRQRYWGCPIPMEYDEQGNEAPATQFPVELPVDVKVTGSGSPLKSMSEFIDCENGRKRETDTFDTFFESSWYYARFCCPDNDEKMLDERAKYWLPVDQYIGGIEHAILHLLYARFFNKLMRDEGLIDNDEPFERLLTQGMVLAETYYREDGEGTKVFYNPADVTVEKNSQGFITSAVLASDGLPVVHGGMEKMSKSKNNGVNPQDMIDKYGADTVRLFAMFASPPEQSLEWNDDAIAGCSRFLRRVWAVYFKHQSSLANSQWQILDSFKTDDKALQAMRLKTHEILQRCLRDFGRNHFNTVVAGAMELTNAIEKMDWELSNDDAKSVLAESCTVLLKLLAPITPHITQTIWSQFGGKGELLDSGWIKVDESALVQDEISYVVQVNGKLRDSMDVAVSAKKEEIETLALQLKGVKRHTEGLTVRKVIVVPKRLVNIVVS